MTTSTTRTHRLPWRAALRRGLRATTGDALLVPRRRAGADAGLLALSAALLAVTVALALLAPRVLLRSADDAVHEAVATAGRDADIVVEPANPVGSGVGKGSTAAVDELLDDASAIEDNLRTALGDLVEPPRSGTSGHEIKVGLLSTAARQLGIAVGTELTFGTGTGGAAAAVVTGLYTPVDPSAPVWAGFRDLLAASPPAANTATVTEGKVGLLLTAESITDAERRFGDQSFTEDIRFVVQPDAIDSRSVATVTRSVRHLFAQPHVLTQWLASDPTVRSTLADVLTAHAARQAAADAQSSVLEVGLAGVGALALVLAARLLVARRRTFLLAERARGASTLSVAVRAAVESVPLAVLATGVGALAAWLILPDARGSWNAAAAVAVVAAFAPPITAAALVHRAWSGRRLPPTVPIGSASWAGAAPGA